MKASLCFVFRGRVSPRRATYFLCFAKESKQRKATLLSASLRFAAAACGARLRGGRRTRFAQTAAALILLRLRSLGATRRGLGNRAGHAALGPHAICRRCAPQPHRAERRRWPVLAPPPLWLRRGAERFADQGRSCLSEASSADPANASTAGCPVAQRRGRRQWGRLSFAYVSLAKQRKVGRPPGRDPASGSKHSTKEPVNDRLQRRPHPRSPQARSADNNNRRHGRDRNHRRRYPSHQPRHGKPQTPACSP